MHPHAAALALHSNDKVLSWGSVTGGAVLACLHDSEASCCNAGIAKQPHSKYTGGVCRRVLCRRVLGSFHD